MRARATLLTIAVVAVAGCKDSGLPDRNLPIDEAAHRPPDALVQAVHPDLAGRGDDMPAPAEAVADRPVQIGDQVFVASGRPVNMDAASLQQVGGSGGLSFYATRGSTAPYDRVWLEHPGGLYVAYMPVHDSGDPHARAEALQQGLAEGGAAH